jgi:hypothetical protein
MALANLLAVQLRLNSIDQKQFCQVIIQFFVIVQNQSVGDFYNYCYDVSCFTFSRAQNNQLAFKKI